MMVKGALYNKMIGNMLKNYEPEEGNISHKKSRNDYASDWGDCIYI
jgi:hypothetical protein